MSIRLCWNIIIFLLFGEGWYFVLALANLPLIAYHKSGITIYLLSKCIYGQRQKGGKKWTLSTHFHHMPISTTTIVFSILFFLLNIFMSSLWNTVPWHFPVCTFMSSLRESFPFVMGKLSLNILKPLIPYLNVEIWISFLLFYFLYKEITIYWLLTTLEWVINLF